jgi:ribosomal protein L13
MQLAIELPDELGQELLQHANVQEFVHQAIKKMLSEEKKTIACQTRTVVDGKNSQIGQLSGRVNSGKKARGKNRATR